MMLGLTAFSGSTSRREREPLPAGVTATEVQAGTGEGGGGPGVEPGVKVTYANGSTHVFRAADGYSLVIRGDSAILQREYPVSKFLNKDNLIGVATAASFIAVMAVAMSGIIILGGIDLSVGSIYALSAVLGAIALNAMGARGGGGTGGGSSPVALALPLGVLVCSAIGAACGFVNGAASVGLRVHPFIITLGGMAVYRGVAFVVTGGESIGDLPEGFRWAWRAQVGGISPGPSGVMLAVAAAGWFVFTRTVFGRRVFAVGGNETAARYAGIPVGRVKVLMFTISGALAGLSASMLLGYYGAASSDAGSGYELRVIAAAVVGGASLSGGRGSAVGAMLGAIVIQLIDNGIVVLGVDSNYTSIVIGLAIVIAVVVDQAKQGLTARKR
jgi:ribose/xylose/arabinose/galactoside ABC-type transport system permease subunit